MMTWTRPDPSDTDDRLFECRACGERLCSSDRIVSCPGCGEDMHNLSVARPV